jgi:hypothetical protein
MSMIEVRSTYARRLRKDEREGLELRPAMPLLGNPLLRAVVYDRQRLMFLEGSSEGEV